ncbi:3',5'-cyclic-AMP phosphodiesterase [Oscillatoria sp. FACHB-1407]|uniref:3',5'-cyclic-AMP phosphodiesterase n=1 Tax=Oscillatoria sp. FACHB-1407 TaxID=2692847 RepID=UPI001686C735|nr:3',5'-cyclic-AMP phosphodiesterase [Oscillatoria sp. FACHB-1407]MBD2462306.1 3',5'-cyclic-AMP phosphodiesterase [Oscillatoria sp. FACHB-1407]
MIFHSAKPSLCIAQISDTHLFATEGQKMLGVATALSCQVVVRSLQALQPQPDVLLMTGDLSQDETPESYKRLCQMISPLGIPAYWIPGNHDVPMVMQEVLQSDSISADKSFQAGGWSFVLLDSAVAGQTDGALSVETLAWLEAQLEAERDRPTLVALHHPPLPIASEWMDRIGLQNPADLFQVLDRHPQVKVVVFGHIHQAFEADRNGVKYLGVPSTCVQFEPKARDFTVDEMQPGFRLLTLHSDGSFATRVERVNL